MRKRRCGSGVDAASFRYGGAHQVSFGTLFRVPVVYELVDKAEIDAIFEKGGWWTDYYKRYPNSQGFLTLSRVGFSPDGKQALLYAKNGCGKICCLVKMDAIPVCSRRE